MNRKSQNLTDGLRFCVNLKNNYKPARVLALTAVCALRRQKSAKVRWLIRISTISGLRTSFFGRAEQSFFLWGGGGSLASSPTRTLTYCDRSIKVRRHGLFFCSPSSSNKFGEIRNKNGAAISVVE